MNFNCVHHLCGPGPSSGMSPNWVEMPAATHQENHDALFSMDVKSQLYAVYMFTGLHW